jgi:hypothetical protein
MSRRSSHRRFAISAVVLVAALAGLSTFLLGQGKATTASYRTGIDRALPEPGDRPSPLAYHWPVKPFGRQHPIRGAFGDPRTLATDQPFGETGPTASGSYSFHDGVDIVAWNGTAVYPVVSGRVTAVSPDEIAVETGDSRTFQYWHLRANVHPGETVVAEHTVLGWVQRPFGHVHLSEVDGRVFVNPAAPGHLEPYADSTTPRAVVLHRADELTIEAVDAPAMPVPGPFAGMPQTPALVEWRLRSGERWGLWHTVADVRKALPASTFWTVYAAGTYQNFPVFNRRRYWRAAGHYLFRTGLDVRALRPGSYILEARVADVRGNSSTTSRRIVVPG